MSKISKSPDRYSFQKEGYINRCKEKGEEPREDYLNMYKSWQQQDDDNMVDLNWQKDNMEYDLRSTIWICEKVQESNVYAQNLYAAMCNNDFQKLDVIPILKDQRWSASWRHSGGIIADMREKGDYIDWYCSGIGNNEKGFGLDGYTPTPDPVGRDYVPEGTVTEEIKEDLKKLGWVAVEWEDED